MNDDEEGKKFLTLITEQNNTQLEIISKISALINSGWDSPNLQAEIKDLVEKHEAVTRNLNGAV